MSETNKSGLGRWLRQRMFAGFLALFPLVVTVWAGKKILGFLDGIIGTTLVLRFPALGQIPGLGIVALFGVLLIAGTLLRSYVGRKAFSLYDRLFTRLPLARTIYVSIKKVLEVVTPEEGKQTFRGAALIEYPRPGVHAVVYVTQDQTNLVDTEGHPLISVFLPTTPNPTSGFVLMVRRSQLIDAKLTVEQATTFIMSMGIVTPEAGARPALPAGVSETPPEAPTGDRAVAP